jgi:uncharacterized protein HemY
MEKESALEFRQQGNVAMIRKQYQEAADHFSKAIKWCEEQSSLSNRAAAYI